MYVHETVLDGAKALLCDVVRIMSKLDQRYVVIGGWSPYLLNASPLPHPGTSDVDILFESGAQTGALKDVVDMFLDEGYLVSAKHAFQLLRIIQVQSQRFVFNVDLLHPILGSGADVNAGMFVDHIDLKIPSSRDRLGNYIVKSIVTPNSGFVLEDGNVAKHDLQATNLAGESVSVEVPLIDEVGLILTKSESINSPKRRRDAFDIYLAIAQSRDYGQMIEQFLRLKTQRENVFDMLQGIRAYIDNRLIGEFGKQVEEFLPAEFRTSGTLVYFKDDPYADRVRQFLGDVGIS